MSNYASLSSRLIALIIDNIILWVIGFIVGLVIDEQILGIGVGFILGILYNMYFWTQNNGQTPGKSMLGVRVVKTDGGKLNALDAIVRYVGYYINTILLLLGWLWAIPDPKNQGLHDKLAGTIVVKA